MDPYNNIAVEESRRVTVSQSTTSDVALWIESTGQLDIDWSGVFSNPYHVNNHFMAEVDALHNTMDDTRADDGNRTLAPVLNNNGITHFEVYWRTGSDETHEQLNPPTATRLTLDPPRDDGDRINLVIQAYDLAGHFKVSCIDYVISTYK